jgi:hypothetical protein
LLPYHCFVYMRMRQCSFPSYIISAPPGYGEDYGTLSRMYAPYGLTDDEYHLQRRSPSIDTEFRGKEF